MRKHLNNLNLIKIFPAAFLLIFAFGFSVAAQETAANSNTNQAADSPTPAVAPTPIAISDIVANAEATHKKLQEIQTSFSESPGVQVIEQKLPNLKQELDARATDTTALLSSRPSLDALNQTEQNWQSLAKNTPTWKKDLKAQIGVLDKQIADLKRQNELWQKTLDTLTNPVNTANNSLNANVSNENVSSNINALTAENTAVQAQTSGEAPPEILQRINEIIAEIKQTQKQIEERRAQFITLQSRVGEQETRVNDTLATIKEVREEALTHLLVQDSPAIWNARTTADSRAGLIQETGKSLATQAAALSEYSARQVNRFLLHGIIFVLLVGTLFWARKRTRPMVEKEPELEYAVTIFKFPIASSLILTILLSGWFYPQAPRLLSSLLGAAALVPVVILLRHLLEKPLFPILNALVIFYFVDRLREVLSALPFVSRVLFLAEMAGAIIFLIWFLRSERLANRVEAQHYQIFASIRKAIPFVLVVFAAALLADLFGYVSLANLIGSGILGSAYIALVLYTAVQILQSLLIFAFRVRPIVYLRMIKEHRALIRAKIFRILKWLAAFFWLILTLDLISVRDTVYSYVKEIFAASLTIGSLSISLGDVVLFSVTIWLAFAISRFVRFVLEEDVYPRVDLSGGVPYAISTMIHYVLLVVGFIMAIAALGFDLTKFTILAGAFGVGLGFGLQNIVNNFVSGLILLFERPVKVGDLVQLGDHQGDLTRIGLRASVLRTVEGADVIVPNSQLISEEVTNWTFADQHRRIDVNVGVAYGNKPEEIINLLAKVALAHENILKTPPPRTLFTEFGDNSLNFQLRAWTDHTDQWMVIKSELAVGIHEALEEANVEIPFPQRDLNLRVISPKAAEIIKSGIIDKDNSN